MVIDNVLYIDGSAKYRTRAERYFSRKTGFNLHTAEDYEKVTKMLDEREYHLIISDDFVGRSSMILSVLQARLYMAKFFILAEDARRAELQSASIPVLPKNTFAKSLDKIIKMYRTNKNKKVGN